MTFKTANSKPYENSRITKQEAITDIIPVTTDANQVEKFLGGLESL